MSEPTPSQNTTRQSAEFQSRDQSSISQERLMDAHIEMSLPHDLHLTNPYANDKIQVGDLIQERYDCCVGRLSLVAQICSIALLNKNLCEANLNGV